VLFADKVLDKVIGTLILPVAKTTARGNDGMIL
jgi:hypothetical protein